MTDFLDTFPFTKHLANQVKSIFESTQQYKTTNKFTNNLFQIPFIDVTCTLAAFQSLWMKTYHMIMNTNGNSLDLVLDKENQCLFGFIMFVSEEGLLEKVIKLDVKQLPKQFQSDQPIQEYFEDISPWIKKQYQMELGNIRLYSLAFLQNIEHIYSETIAHSQDLFQTIGKYMQLLFSARNAEKSSDLWVELYPIPSLIQFVDSWSPRITTSSTNTMENRIHSLFAAMIPPLRSTITVTIEESFLSYYLDTRSGQIQPEFIPFPSKFHYNVADPQNNIEEYLHKIGKLKGSTRNFYIKVDELIDLISAILESKAPLSLTRIDILAQKFLHFYRSYGFLWDISPKPAIFQEQIRYFFNMLKIPLNLRKLAYWRIPSFVIQEIMQNVGISGKFLLIFGSHFKELTPATLDRQSENMTVLQISLEKGEIIEGRLQAFNEWMNHKSIDISQIQPSVTGDGIEESPKQESSIHEISQTIYAQTLVSDNPISSIYWISADLIQEYLLMTLGDIFTPYPIFWRKIKHVLKSFKSEEKFAVYPRTQLYEMLLKQRSSSFLKKLLPNLVELHEF